MSWSFFGGKPQHKNRKVKRARQNSDPPMLSRRRPRFEELEARHMLAVLTVNADGANSDLVGADAFFTLREAINTVNAVASAGLSPQEIAQIDTTTSPLGTDDIIQFAGVTSITLTLVAGGELLIINPLTIDGPGAGVLTIDAVGLSRVFNLDATAGEVTFKDLILTGGMAAPGADGGAIFSQSLGTLTLADITVTGSAAPTGNGGGIYAAGPLTLTNSTITGNNAGLSGGGVYGIGNLVVSRSVVSGNNSGVYGGGILGTGNVTIEGSTIGGTGVGTANMALLGGGGVHAANIVVQNSAIRKHCRACWHCIRGRSCSNGQCGSAQ
jgi:predicted outer membrane repeat protein